MKSFGSIWPEAEKNHFLVVKEIIWNSDEQSRLQALLIIVIVKCDVKNL